MIFRFLGFPSFNRIQREGIIRESRSMGNCTNKENEAIKRCVFQKMSTAVLMAATIKYVQRQFESILRMKQKKTFEKGNGITGFSRILIA